MWFKIIDDYQNCFIINFNAVVRLEQTADNYVEVVYADGKWELISMDYDKFIRELFLQIPLHCIE